MIRFEIIDLTADNTSAIQQTARILVDAFRESHPQAWQTMDDALEEVKESFEEGRISRIAVQTNSEVLGWVGAIPEYDGQAWELHPLVVKPQIQKSGVGSALVSDLERLIRERGGVTIYLGTDDETGQTSLSGVNLYSDLWGEIMNIKNLRQHPYEFYQKVGFQIVGVIPDANGVGKPDILMAKSLQS